MKQKLGKAGEIVAKDFLESQGYVILAMNWRYSHKEIDIIAQYESLLVFIEVKTRRKKTNLLPQDLFSKSKQRYYIACAFAYRNRFGMEEYGVRFDIICIHASKDSLDVIEHWRDVIDVRQVMDCGNPYW